MTCSGVWRPQVTATCSTDAVALVESLGADVVIDYTAPEAEEHLSLMRGSVGVSGRPNSVLSVPVYLSLIKTTTEE